MRGAKQRELRRRVYSLSKRSEATSNDRSIIRSPANTSLVAVALAVTFFLSPQETEALCVSGPERGAPGVRRHEAGKQRLVPADGGIHTGVL